MTVMAYAWSLMSFAWRRHCADLDSPIVDSFVAVCLIFVFLTAAPVAQLASCSRRFSHLDQTTIICLYWFVLCAAAA